jgi:hypothetical protein
LKLNFGSQNFIDFICKLSAPLELFPFTFGGRRPTTQFGTSKDISGKHIIELFDLKKCKQKIIFWLELTVLPRFGLGQNPSKSLSLMFSLTCNA